MSKRNQFPHIRPDRRAFDAHLQGECGKTRDFREGVHGKTPREIRGALKTVLIRANY
jgi:hypothetical protein